MNIKYNVGISKNQENNNKPDDESEPKFDNNNIEFLLYILMILTGQDSENQIHN